MEINVGDYVRAFRGINKVIRIEPYNNSYFYYTDGKNNNEGKPFYFERHITKHSKDIIDLIEVGDYVNGREVTSFGYDHNDKVIYVNTISCLSFENDEIETVLTKQQFEANAYKIEKEV